MWLPKPFITKTLCTRSIDLHGLRAACSAQVQSLAKLQQPAVVVRSRKEDSKLVQESIEPARQKFTQVYGGEAPSVNFDADTFLPEAPTGG